MFFSFRSRLFLLSLALIAGFLLITGVYLHQTLRGWTESMIEADLRDRAHLVAQSLKALDQEDARQSFIDEIGDLGYRITLIGGDGRVLADNTVEAERLADLDDHNLRPEIVAAREDGLGRARRRSTSTGTDLLYVALDLPDTDSVVRVAMPLSDVDQVLGHLRLLLFIGGLFGLGVAIFMSSFASSMMSRHLQELLARSRESDRSPSGGSVRELTRELERTMGTLAEERDRFRAVLEGMSEGVLVLDEKHRVTLINPAARLLLDASDAVHGRPLEELVPNAPLFTLFEEAHNAGQAMAEFTLDPPGVRLLAHGTSRKGAGLILVLHDVTAIRRLETMRRDFVANVSHELRTPVAVIQANAETLLDGALDTPDHARRFTDGIHRNAERLTRLIADLLDISRIEAGRRTFQPEEIQLAAAVGDTIEAAPATEESPTLLHEVDPSIRVIADPGALDQVLLNLLDNALKFTPEDGAIILRAQPRDLEVLIEVLDDGPGVEPAHQERIFERFYRADEGRTPGLGGTGLGLSIVKHLVTAMGGEVGYSRRDEGGARFWFTLPVAPPRDDDYTPGV